MRVADLASLPGFETLQPDGEDAELTGAYTSDLLSDVMAHAPAGGVLITIQAHTNTIAVASLVGLRAVILCNGRPVPDDMLAAARREHIRIYRTADHQFQTSILVHQSLTA